MDSINRVSDILPNISKEAPTNHKAKLFVEHYVISRNPLGSAKKVGYKNPSSAAKRLMSNVTVRGYIEERIQEEVRKVRMSKDDYLICLQRELDNSKQETTRARLLQLQADVLGFTKPDQDRTQVNVFGCLDEAMKLFDVKKVIEPGL